MENVMKVERLMSRGVHACSSEDPMSRAAQIMWECDCGSVPVVDGTGKVTAVITDRDICMAAYTQGKPLSEMPVSLAASRRLVTVRESDSVEAAERRMQEHQIRRVPVVDANGKLRGVLSMGDIARAAQVTATSDEGVTHEEVATTLAAISQPHRPEVPAPIH